MWNGPQLTAAHAHTRPPASTHLLALFINPPAFILLWSWLKQTSELVQIWLNLLDPKQRRGSCLKSSTVRTKRGWMRTKIGCSQLHWPSERTIDKIWLTICKQKLLCRCWNDFIKSRNRIRHFQLCSELVNLPEFTLNRGKMWLCVSHDPVFNLDVQYPFYTPGVSITYCSFNAKSILTRS